MKVSTVYQTLSSLLLAVSITSNLVVAAPVPASEVSQNELEARALPPLPIASQSAKAFVTWMKTAGVKIIGDRNVCFYTGKKSEDGQLISEEIRKFRPALEAKVDHPCVTIFDLVYNPNSPARTACNAWSVADWTHASVALAEVTSGTARVVCGPVTEPTSIFFQYEYPVIKEKGLVTEFWKYVWDQGQLSAGEKLLLK